MDNWYVVMGVHGVYFPSFMGVILVVFTEQKIRSVQ